MTLNPTALDRYITGNYGEDQFPEDEPDCNHYERVYLGDEPDPYEDVSYPTYQCVGCGDLFDAPGRSCAHPIRDGRCTLDPHHRGRHTTVSHYCDGCDKRRRSRPEAYARNPYDGTTEAQFCFMCVRKLTN